MMPGTVKVKLGNLFDGPCDLMVLPCSTGWSVTGFVARSLATYSIPFPKVGMQLGEVELLPFDGAENIAQYVVFAASVRRHSSSIDAISEIGRSLGRFTKQEESIRAISAPLLGAGAGGLQSEKVIATLKEGFTETAVKDACLTIHVLHEDVFDRLRGNRARIDAKTKNQIRTFISHTSVSEREKEWVKLLALFLIDNGIQARLDHFHLRRGMDLPQWMCNELAMADKVIIVCDEIYKMKADGRLGGVGWETLVIQGDLASLPPDSTKYQVIVRSEEIDDGLPLYLKTKYIFHAKPSDQNDSGKEELIRDLLDLPLDIRFKEKEFTL